MYRKLRSTTTHEVTVKALECVAPGNEGDLLVRYWPMLSQTEFVTGWQDLVVSSAIDALAIHEGLDEAHFYLGHWTEPQASTHPVWGAQVTVLEDDVYDYGHDVTYIGWRVTVSAEEVNWTVV